MDFLILLAIIATSFWWIPMLLMIFIIFPMAILHDILTACGVEVVKGREKDEK